MFHSNKSSDFNIIPFTYSLLHNYWHICSLLYSYGVLFHSGKAPRKKLYKQNSLEKLFCEKLQNKYFLFL